MADQTGNPNIVTVSSGPAHGLAEPKFIIKDGDVYYVTLAVWDYDPKKAETQQHKDALKQVMDSFANGQKLEAVKVAAGGAQSSPPPPPHLALFSASQSNPPS